MANKELKFVISADDKASGAIKGIGDTAKGMGDRVQKYGKLAAAGITVIAGAAIAAATSAVNMARDFEKSMSNISTLIDTSDESMADMSKQVLEMSKKTPVQLSELSAALYDVRSAGIDADDAMGVLESSAKLGVTGLGTTKEAATLMTLAMNNFRDAGYDADQVANIMFKTVKGGITTIADLSQSFGLVAPLAVETGVSLEELQAVTAALTQVNKSGSISQNSIKAALVSLLKPTKEATNLFEKLGVETFKELIEKSGGLVGAFGAMHEASDGNTESFAKAMGSGEALTAVNALLGAQSDAVSESMEYMKDQTDVVQEAFEKQTATFDAQYQMLRNNLNAVMISLGTHIIPMLNKAIEFLIPIITQASEWFTHLMENGLEAESSMGKFASFIKDYVIPVIKAAFDFLVEIVNLFRKAWDSNFLFIQDHVAIFMATIGNLFKTGFAVIEGLLGFLTAAMKGDFAGMQDAVIDSVVKIYTAWQPFLENMSNAWKSAWQGISDFFDNMWQHILTVLEGNINVAIDMLNQLIRAINRIPGVSIPQIQPVALSRAKKESAQSALGAMSGIMGARATGGAVTMNRPYLVGERGAEMFVPNQSGRIMPSGGMGGVTINITGNTIDSQSRIDQIATAIEQKLSRQMQLQRFGIS